MKVGHLNVFLVLCTFGDCGTVADYYSVLNVKRSATGDEIKWAYKMLLQRLHPDKNKHDPYAHEKTTLINEAYNTLKHKTSRNEYDRMNPSAGKEATPYDWGKPISQKDHSLVVFHPICSYVGNAIVKAVHWVFVLHYRDQSENVSIVWGISLAFTASYVYRIPILMFLMLLLAVLDKLHLAVMILISVIFIRILKVKYFPGLILLWMIYLYILDYVINNLTLELKLRVFVFLFQNATFIMLYSMTSLVLTTIIFWIHKPHQNIRTKRIVAFLQQATAFFYLHKAMPEKHLVGVLPFHLIIVASSEFSIFIFKEIWRFVRYILYKFYSYLEDSLKFSWNLLSSIMWKCVGVCNIILNLYTICLIVYLGMNFQALITCYDITKFTVILSFQCLTFLLRSVLRYI